MDYELTKKLKDAGYPVGYGDSDTPGIGWVPNLEAREYSKTYMTGFSLSELIEGCPKSGAIDSNKTFALVWVSPENRWLAGYEAYEDFENPCYGTTPEEAVANLWLALNSTHSE